MASSVTIPQGQTWCLDPGPLRPLVAEFTDHLASLSHTMLTVGGYGDAARHFAAWLQQSGMAIAQVDDETCAEFAAHQCRCPGIRRCDRISLDTIGTILRHRSTTTTAHYAKVNNPMLLQIAQPWPGEVSC